MIQKTLAYLLVAILIIGSVPGIAALGIPTEGTATGVAATSDGPTSVEVCNPSDETLTVDAGPDFQTSKDKTVRFVADLDPDDADDRVSSYEWRDESGNQNKGKGKGKNAGQGPGGQVLSTQKSFETTLKAGKHTITLTVETTDGRTLTDTVNVTVRGKGGGAERDSPPEADTGDCRMVIANEDTQLDGSESYDRDGTIENYDWDLDGDGTTDVTGETPTVQFHELGNRTVELTVTDDGGNTDTDTVNLLVNDRPLAAFEYAPTRPNPNESVTFDATSASDDLGGIDAYRWDFDGDGVTDATGENVAHAFATPGNHTVTLTVTDAYGVNKTTARTVHVNYPPTANASESDQRVNVSETFALDGTASTDPEGEIARYEWDVDGDGEFEKTGANVSHVYETAGNKIVALRVTDDGNLTDTDTISIQVNSPPTARIEASNETVVIGESVVFDGTDSTDDDGDIVRYEWDLNGDGETDATGETVEHTFENDGDATVRLTVTDDDGATDTATETVVVLPDQIDDEPPGLPAPPDHPEGGSGTGDPHYTTFDGQNYDFQGAGEFVLAREPNGSLSVQGRLVPWSDRPVSVAEAIATSVDGHNVTIDAADATPLVVDGERHSLNQTDRLAVGNGTIFRRGSKYIVVYPGSDGEVDDGDERLTVELRGNFVDVWLTLRDDRAKAVEGILGTPAEDAPDVALANGTAVSPSDYETMYGPFRADWRVDSLAESHFHYEDGESPDSFYNPDYPDQFLTVDDLSDDDRSDAEQAAIEAGLEPGTAAFRNAVLDYALTGDEAYLESAALSQPANATFSVDAGRSFAANVSTPATFATTVSNESAANVIVEWRFGDGETATGTQVSHAYDEVGTYTVTVTATGPNGGIARDTLAVTVGENVTTDQPPIVNVETTRPNETHARLDASESIDPDGTIAGYAWDIDGDGTADSHDSTVTVPLSSDSTEVSLVVLDDDGNRDSATVLVPDRNDAPTANLTASPTTVETGESVLFDASDSSDPDGDSLTYEWDFDGDGTVDATGATVNHSYSESGTYTATLRVTDEAGATTTETTTITVESGGEFFDGFEAGLDDWSQYNGISRSSVSYEGSYSAHADEHGSFGKHMARRAVFPGGDKPSKFSVYLRENSDSNGGGVRLFNSEGNSEVGFAFDNPQWHLTDGDGNSRIYDGDGYRRWVYVEFTFDWASNSYDYYVKDLRSGHVETGTRSLDHGVDIETVHIDNFGQYWGDYGNDNVELWVDNIQFGDNEPPVAAASVNQTSVQTGETVTFDASDSSDPDGDSLTYEWDFDGDGTTDATGETVSHSYSEAGTYEAMVTVTDERGATETDTVSVTVKDDVPTDGLVAHWKLDSDGTDSVGVYDGVVNGETSFVDGKVGRSAEFDGSDDDIEITTNDRLPTEAITIATWVKFDRSPGDTKEFILSAKHFGHGEGWGIKSANGRLHFDISTGSWSAISVSESFDSVGLESGQWHHVAATWNGNTMALYVDGSKVATRSYSGSITYGDTEPAIASMRRGFDKHNFDGLLDDARIYDRALNSSEVNELYNATN